MSPSILRHGHEKLVAQALRPVKSQTAKVDGDVEGEPCIHASVSLERHDMSSGVPRATGIEVPRALRHITGRGTEGSRIFLDSVGRGNFVQ